MKATKMTKAISSSRLLLAAMAAFLLTATAYGAAPGITTSTGTFLLTAQDAYLNQPDGQAVYSWGYGCKAGFAPTFLPNVAFIQTPACPTMQVPGPTLIVNEGTTVTITLTNNLPTAAGNTSILFPGFNVCAATLNTSTGACTGTPTGVTGLLTQEAAPGGSVTYTFVASAPGTHPYYSGTQGDLQVEMGLYGALIVLPKGGGPMSCNSTNTNLYGKPDYGSTHGIQGFPEQDFRLAHAAYDHPRSCYDREYLFQWAEMDSRIHKQALAQVTATISSGACTAGYNPASNPACSLNVQTEPYHPAYFLINGRSMPDLMDPNYAAEYPHQPYNGNPHMHPGELTLVRTIGQGRWQHPFHEHANHVRILGRDGNLVLSPTTPTQNLAGILMFNTDTTPGESFDGIFYFSGRGLNWDAYGHHPAPAPCVPGPGVNCNNLPPTDPLASLSCTPDANGYNTGVAAQTALNYYEWCQDHNKPVQSMPFGDVAGGGPATLPDPNVLTNGPWYGGTPYLGPDANLRATTPGCDTTPYNTATTTAAGCTTLAPSNVQANPANERGWAFMWHSHNEREITTNNVFPGGMLMMMLVDSREFPIDESQ
jgi:FtsP/CotA-like multicopper oxidase with cupredoxin domain